MKLIIAGSRGFNNYSTLIEYALEFIEKNLKNNETVTIVSGTARGADQMGERLAREHKFPLVLMPADWDTFGRRAGVVRNEEMAKVATHCIVFWDGESPGTKHMIAMCKRYKLTHTVVRV